METDGRDVHRATEYRSVRFFFFFLICVHPTFLSCCLLGSNKRTTAVQATSSGEEGESREGGGGGGIFNQGGVLWFRGAASFSGNEAQVNGGRTFFFSRSYGRAC